MFKIGLTVPAGAMALVEAALEPFTAAQSSFVEDERTDRWRIEGYCDVAPDPAALATALAVAARAAGIDEPAHEITPVAARDWVAENQASFAPLRVARFFIHPSHYTGPVPCGAIAIRIDAGMAFGTGAHATTAGCLEALDQIARRRRPHRVLDLGCGSGILAIAAARLWRRPVLASDLDPVAARIAQANARHNRAAPWVRTLTAEGLRHPHLRRRFDLIAANILARPLIRLAGDIVRQLAPGGYVILSGVLNRQAGAVTAPYRSRGLQLVARHGQAEWTTLILRKPRRRRIGVPGP